MEIRTEAYETKLCPEAVDEFSGYVRSFLEALKLPKRDILRYAMTLEEILLKSAERKNDGSDIRLSMGRKFMSYFLILEVDGDAFNVYADNETEQGVLGGALLKNLGLSPEYRRMGDVNRYSFLIKKKSSSPFVSLAIAAVSAMIMLCFSLSSEFLLRHLL